MNPMRRPMHEKGMTLVEVLVTLVVISVGLLGVAALQLTTLKSNQEAYVRSQASALAGYMLDRIRANQQALVAGDFVDVPFNGTGTAGTRSGTDLADWQAEIDRLLPGGPANAAGRITSVNSVVTIEIQWAERADQNTGAQAGNVTFRTRTEI